MNNSNKPLNPLNDPYPIDVPVTVAPNCSNVVVLFESESSASSLIISYQINGAGPVLTATVPAPPQNCPSCVPPAP